MSKPNSKKTQVSKRIKKVMDAFEKPSTQEKAKSLLVGCLLFLNELKPKKTTVPRNVQENMHLFAALLQTDVLALSRELNFQNNDMNVTRNRYLTALTDFCKERYCDSMCMDFFFINKVVNDDISITVGAEGDDYFCEHRVTLVLTGSCIGLHVKSSIIPNDAVLAGDRKNRHHVDLPLMLCNPDMLK